MGYIDSGKAAGATVALGGDRHGTEGYFINPTIFTDVTPEMQIVQEEILRLLDRLQRELSLAYMFITHDLATVRAIADEVVVMQGGRVVEQGPKAEIFEGPHAPYTELLLSSVPEMDPGWLDRVLADRGAL